MPKTSREKPARNATAQVALLRGINVGGKNKLPMKDLAEMFVKAGAEKVQTYIQSGNVIFHAPARVAAGLPAQITAQIAKKFGYQIPVQLRTVDEIADVIAGNPFTKTGADETALHVMFLAGLPGAQAVAGLDADRSPPDKFIVRNREIYLHLPNGAADTKLTNAYFDSKLATISTGRNWRTVNQLLELMRG